MLLEIMLLKIVAQ